MRGNFDGKETETKKELHHKLSMVNYLSLDHHAKFIMRKKRKKKKFQIAQFFKNLNFHAY